MKFGFVHPEDLPHSYIVASFYFEVPVYSRFSDILYEKICQYSIHVSILIIVLMCYFVQYMCKSTLELFDGIINLF